MQIGTTQLRRLSRAAIIATAIFVTVTMVGCYWTPPEDEGAISISLNNQDVQSSSVGASATDTVDTFFFAQIASESLLRGEPDVAEAAIAEANQELQAQFEELATDPNSTDFDSFEVTVSVPDVQLQAAFLNLGDATGSSSSFSGLRAGESYLVTVFAGAFDPETQSNPDFSVGYATATITGGETQTVNLTLDATFENYAQFLFDEYGIESIDDGTAQDEPQTGELYIFASQASDAFPDFPAEQPDVHFDIIDASSDSINFDNHKVEEAGQLYASDFASQDVTLANRLTQMNYLSIDNTTIDPTSGTRPILPSDGSSVGTVTVGQEIQIVVTDASTRGVDDTQDDVAEFIGITSPFTFGEDPTPIVYYYAYTSGY